MTSPTGIMTSQPLFQNTVILRRPGVAIFADIIKIITRFIRKTQEKLKELEICIKMQSMSVFFDITKFADFWCKNANVSRNHGVCQVIDIFFGSFLGKV